VAAIGSAHSPCRGATCGATAAPARRDRVNDERRSFLPRHVGSQRWTVVGARAPAAPAFDFRCDGSSSHQRGDWSRPRARAEHSRPSRRASFVDRPCRRTAVDARSPMDGQDSLSGSRSRSQPDSTRESEKPCGRFRRRHQAAVGWSTIQRASAIATPALGTRRALLNEVLLFHRSVPSPPQSERQPIPDHGDTTHCHAIPSTVS